MEKEAQDIFFFKGSLLPPYNLYKKFHGMRFHIKSHLIFLVAAAAREKKGLATNSIFVLLFKLTWRSSRALNLAPNVAFRTESVSC